MDRDLPPLTRDDAPDHADPADQPSVSEELRQLKEEALAFARAELAYQKVRAGYAGKQAKRIAGFGVLALVLVFFALMALIVGAVIALTPLVTAWGATALVTIALLVCAGFCGMAASSTAKRMARTLADKEGGNG